jgi:hypothetical protein
VIVTLVPTTPPVDDKVDVYDVAAGSDAVNVRLAGSVRPSLLVEESVPTPAALGVNVTVTGVVLFKLTVVGLKVPLMPDTEGVIVADVAPFPVYVRVIGDPVVPVEEDSLEV